MTYKAMDPLMLNLCPYSFLGNDTLGHPVMVLSIGRWGLTQIVDEGREAEYFHFTTQITEQLIQRIRESNGGRQPWEFQNTQFTAIVDWAGYSLQQLVNYKGMQSINKKMP